MRSDEACRIYLSSLYKLSAGGRYAVSPDDVFHVSMLPAPRYSSSLLANLASTLGHVEYRGRDIRLTRGGVEYVRTMRDD